MAEKLSPQTLAAVEAAPSAAALVAARAADTRRVMDGVADKQDRKFCVEQAVKVVATSSMSNGDFTALINDLYAFVKGATDAGA